MNHVIQDTIKQLYNLIWFCRKVQIPFEVYAFTNEFRSRVDGIDELDGYRSYRTSGLKPHFEKKDGLLVVEESFCLMNFFSSKSKQEN